MAPNDFNNLLSSIKTLSPAQMRRLHRQLDRQISPPMSPTAKPPTKSSDKTKVAAPEINALTRDELNQRLIADGLINALPDPGLDIDDNDPDDAPVIIRGERLSETIIRERR
jgi:hypothetical protein